MITNIYLIIIIIIIIIIVNIIIIIIIIIVVGSAITFWSMKYLFWVLQFYFLSEYI